MGGGTKLSEEAHLTGSIRAFVANQVNVAISRFLGYTVKSLNVPPRIGFDWFAPLKQWILLICLVTRNFVWNPQIYSSNILRFDSNVHPQMCFLNVPHMCLLNAPPDLTQMCLLKCASSMCLKCASSMCLLNVPPQKDEARPQIYAGRKNKHGRPVKGPKLLFMVHIHTIFTEFTHFCRKISLVAFTRFGRHFLAKIWWEEAPKHFIGPGYTFWYLNYYNQDCVD